MFLLFKRINIFLLSFFIIFAPVTNFAYAIDPIVPPFTSAPAAADVAASLGSGGSGGFSASSLGLVNAAAAIGVGVGSYCLASAAIGNFQNACGSNSPICNALQSIGITNCMPKPDGSFSKPVVQSNDPPASGNFYYYAQGQNGDVPCCSANSAVPLAVLSAAFVTFMNSLGKSNNPLIPDVTYNFDYTTGDTEPFQRLYLMGSNGNLAGLLIVGVPSIIKPDIKPEKPLTPEDVGRAIAGNPAAAAALGAAAAAAANSGCNGTMGTFNGVSTCVPALGPSNNPSCSGFYGLVNGQSVCVPALGAGGNPACSGYSGEVNGASTCIPAIGANPACSGFAGTFNGSPLCLKSVPDNGINFGLNPAEATKAAVNAASAATANPPAQRSCPSNFKLDVTGICINTTIPERGNGDCKIGYVFSGNTCIPADPLNPSRPATTTPATAAQSTANAAAAAASTSLTQARANAQAATAAAAANPADQTKAAAAVAAAAALQQATLDAVAANTAATAEATAKPKPMELPAFCGWAAIVCAAITWAKTDAIAPTDTAVTVKSDTPSAIQNLDINKSYFNFGAQCPADVPVTFSLMGKSTTLNIKYTLVCDFLSKLRPFVIGSAWIAGAFIISGASRSGGGDS